MNEDWKKDVTPIPATALPTNYALTADPGKPLREAKQEIERLNKQITIMRSDYLAQMNTVITERDVYRNLVLKIMKIKD